MRNHQREHKTSGDVVRSSPKFQFCSHHSASYDEENVFAGPQTV